jgi:methionine biosynthesis protein MetW
MSPVKAGPERGSRSIDSAEVNDNRRYRYPVDSVLDRAEYPWIVELVERGARVVDFGCGDGSLLQRLQVEKQASGVGYDISRSAVEACRRKGIEAVCAPIDQPRGDLAEGQFDYAICNVTIQMVMYPEVLLREMARVARRQIVSFPNFAFYRNRLDLLLRGRMPRPMIFGYKWYSTGHIHHLSIDDFLGLVAEIGGLEVLAHRHPDETSGLNGLLARRWPNLFQSIAIFMLGRRDAP